MQSPSNIEYLFKLAQEPSSEKRRELLRKVTDIFLVRPESHSHDIRKQFGDLLGELAGTSSTESRVDLANRLASIPSAPEHLIKQLAGDEIDVAAPILEHSKVLTDADLIEVVHSKGSAHQSSVARRSEVGEDVSSALVEVGHTDAVQILLENARARINRLAMEKAIARSNVETTLQNSLVDRHDMPIDLLQDMFWFSSGEIRKKIIAISGAAESDALDDSADVAQNPAPAPKYDADKRSAKRYIDRMIATGQFGRLLIIDLFKRRAFVELIIGFAILVCVDESTALRILSDENGESLVLACKASGFDIGTFATMARLGTLKNPRPVPVLGNMLAMFESVTDSVAKRAMRFWRIRESVTRNDT